MYHVEQYMKFLKGYVKKNYHPEASMIERYIAEESIEFCSKYMSKSNRPSNQLMTHMRSISKCLRGIHVVSKSRSEVLKVHLYILNKTDGVILYLYVHKVIVKANNPSQQKK